MANKKDKVLKLWPNVIKMANIEERLTAVLEEVVALQTASRQMPPHKEIAYIPEFCGEPQKLTQFLSIVETHMEATAAERKPLIWTNIRNLRIGGKAKELILNNNVTTWEATKQLFTQHFRPIINLKEIIRRINGLKVSSILELCHRLENLVSEINSYAVYEADRNSVKNMLYQTLLVKIKELATGSLARDLKSIFDIHQTKEILFTYIGFDDNLEHRNYQHHPKPNPPKPKTNPPFQSGNSLDRQPNHRFGNDRPQRSYSDRFNQNSSYQDRSKPPNNYSRTFNPSGQFRNAVQNPQPMDVDNIHKEESNNNIEDQVFLN